MKNRNTHSFLYSFLFHGMIFGVFVLLLWEVQEEKIAVITEKRTVVKLSQFTTAVSAMKKPIKKVKKRPIQKKIYKKKSVKKRIKKKVTKPKIRKTVPLKKAPPKVKVVEEIIEVAPVVEEKLVEESELVVTPTKPVELSPTAKKEIAAPATSQSTPEDLYIKAHIAEIMALLRKNLYYPRMARKRHMQGKVTVRFELMRDGSIRNIKIIEAKRELLGRAAVTTIERLEGKFPHPKEKLLLTVPIMYQLK